MSTIGQSIYTENTFFFLVKGQGNRWGEWRVATYGYQLPFWSTKSVLNLIVVTVTQLCGYTKKTIELYKLSELYGL